MLGAKVERDELAIAGMLFFFFFLIIAVFQILKPLKAGLFVSHYGAEIELYAKLTNIVVAGLGAAAFSLLYNRFARQQLLYALSAFFFSWFIALAGVMHRPDPFSIWAFYILGDLEATVMVVAFWAYLTDISSPSQGKRLFGLIGAGGVFGGWAGVSLAKLLLEGIGSQGLLLVAAAFMGLVMLLVSAIEGQIVRTKTFRPAMRLRVVREEEPRQVPSRTQMWEGGRLVMRSRYLLAIAGILVSYEFASQLIDYQFKLAAESLSGETAAQAFFIDIGFYASSLAVVVQLFLVGALMKRFGLGVTLLVLPVAIIGGSIGFLVLPAIVAASLLAIFDNGLNYSIQQTGRESLYLVATPEEKYKARAFVQMFLQRLAKGLSVVAVLVLGAMSGSTEILTVMTVGVMGLMVVLSLYAGRHFSRASTAQDSGGVSYRTHRVPEAVPVRALIVNG